VSKKARDLREQVRTWLKEFGASRCEFEVTGGCHQRVVFFVGQRRLSYVFSSTAGDRRTGQNTRSGLRHLIASATGSSLSAVSQGRPVLDAGGVLPREPHDVGGCRARARSHPQAMAYAAAAGLGQVQVITARS
jgi:hypothetical protein